MDKSSVVMEYLSQFPVTKLEQSLIAEATKNVSEEKICAKIVEFAYRYSLLLETKYADTKRGVTCLKRLSKACSEFNEIKTKTAKNIER